MARQALRAPRRDLRGIEDTGRRIGRELAPDQAGGADEALETTLIALGFHPTLLHGDDGELTFFLGNCSTCSTHVPGAPRSYPVIRMRRVA